MRSTSGVASGVVGAADADGVGLAAQPAAGGEHDRAGPHRRARAVAAGGRASRRHPSPRGASSTSRVASSTSAPLGAHRRPQRLDHLGAGPLADLQQPLAARAAAAQQPEAAVVAAEGDAQRLEPGDRVGPALGEPGAPARAARRGGRRRRCPRSATRSSRRRRAPPGCRPGRARCSPAPRADLVTTVTRAPAARAAQGGRHPGAARPDHEHVGARVAGPRHRASLADGHGCFQ